MTESRASALPTYYQCNPCHQVKYSHKRPAHFAEKHYFFKDKPDMRQKDRCMVCGGAEFVPYQAGRYGKDIYVCPNCKLVFTNPQPEPNELLTRYGADYYAHWVSPKQQIRRRKLWARRVAVVKRVLPYGKLLDVGCGEGLFLHCAQRAGYEVAGVEVSEFAVKYAQENWGLTIRHATLEAADFPRNEFDIITFWHTLEHLPSPDITLQKAYQLLKPGGYLIVAVPNVDDIIAQKFYRLVQGHYFQIYTPESKEPHLYHFSADTLKLLLEKCNFSIVASGADFCHVDPYWRVIEHISCFYSKLFRQQAYLANLAISRK